MGTPRGRVLRGKHTATAALEARGNRKMRLRSGREGWGTATKEKGVGPADIGKKKKGRGVNLS